MDLTVRLNFRQGETRESLNERLSQALYGSDAAMLDPVQVGDVGSQYWSHDETFLDWKVS